MKRVYGAYRGPAPTLFAAMPAGILPTPLDNVDLSHVLPPSWDQGQTSACVGYGIAAGLYLAVGAKGKPPSPQALYVLARSREKQRVGDALRDTGSNPIDAVEAAITTGICPWDLYDGEMTGADAINQLLSFQEVVASVPVPASSFSAIDEGDTDTITRWLTAGAGVAYASEVDASYESYSSGVWPGMTGPSLGGHEQLIVGYENGYFIVRNSWGPNFGYAGHSHVAEAAIQSGAHSLIAISGGVIL